MHTVAPLVHALLTYPSGRTRSPALAALIGLAYVDGLFPDLARDPFPTIVLMALVVGAATLRYARARGLERRALAVPLAGANRHRGASGRSPLSAAMRTPRPRGPTTSRSP